MSILRQDLWCIIDSVSSQHAILYALHDRSFSAMLYVVYHRVILVSIPSAVWVREAVYGSACSHAQRHVVTDCMLKIEFRPARIGGSRPSFATGNSRRWVTEYRPSLQTARHFSTVCLSVCVWSRSNDVNEDGRTKGSKTAHNVHLLDTKT